ncbi:MAG TPA: hypothetical protein VF498_19570 [Anaerolineales bacterium]
MSWACWAARWAAGKTARIARLQPQVELLSPVAGGKRLPDPAVLDALEGYNLLLTDQNGWIHLITDGEKMWVETEK